MLGALGERMAPPGPPSRTPFCVALHLLLALPLGAAPIIWTGGSSSDFTLGSNWTGSSPPANDLITDIAMFSVASPTNQPVLNSAYSVNGVSMTGGYTLSGSGPLTLGSSGFQATGTNTLSLQSLLLGANAALNLASTTTISSGVNINTNGFTLTLRTQETSGLNLSNAVISGSGNVIFSAGSGSRVVQVGPSNTFTGSVHVSTTNVSFSSLANGGVASSFGQGTGDVTLGDASSVVAITYTGTAAGATDRLFKAGNNSAGVTITNNSTGALEFNNTGAYGGAITSEGRALTLSGSHTVAITAATGHSSFAQLLNDFADQPLTLVKSGAGVWHLTNLNNSFTGGVTISEGILRIAGDGVLGNVDNDISITGNGGLAATAGTTIPATRTITVSSSRTATFNILSGGTTAMIINAKITGGGSVQRSSGSASATGQVRFANDANDFTGNFSTTYGTTEFTSVANAGQPSALGAGAGITIANSTSAINFRYVGSTNTTTTRAINWTSTAGGLSMTNNGTGTVGFLATTSLVSAINSKPLIFNGTNTGNNVFAQVINNGTNGQAVSVTKNGVGRWILTGANSYTGATLISGGNLQVGLGGIGSIAADSAVSLTVATARLSGTGSVLGTTTLTLGAITPGDEGGASAGKLTFGDLTFANVEAATVINLSLVDFDTFDQIDVTGTLTINSRTNILVEGSAYTPVLGDSFELLSWLNLTNDGFTAGGMRSGGNGGSNLTLPDLSTFNPAWYWEISNLSMGGLVISVVIPEPGRMCLFALGLLAWTMKRRR